MTIFKCKMCGGTLEINNNESVAVCEYCGTKQTLPHLDNDKKANLYDRANHFRRNNEFDKAMSIYENILNEDTTDAEAYWSLVLCRYGIEYVEDPATHKRVPTVNRAQFTSIFDDDNYKSALQYADGYQKSIYEEEANAINEIQKGILEISQKEEPFDVFICYKETDQNGRRTPDSVLANDLYHQLTEEGFKVFFARITLEDKLGSAYEPYIFAALNSAKVMVVLGTKPECFNAVWVKNEWSRYLSLVKASNGKKIIIPAYRDMDPYDLPEEFSHLQAQDMSKLGFMQDLIRGIKKIVQTDELKTTVVKETVITNTSNSNTAPLLKRAFMFLEDGDWQSANEYCEKVLDMDPECAEAYLGKLMAEVKVKKQEQLGTQAEEFTNNINYQKVLRFANASLKLTIEDYAKNVIYLKANKAMNSAKIENEYQYAISIFARIKGYKDADAKRAECIEKAEICRKDALYVTAMKHMNEGTISSCENAILNFQKIEGYKDSDKKIEFCKRKIEEIKEKKEADRLERKRRLEQERIKAEKRKKLYIKIAKIASPIVAVLIVFIIILNAVIIPNNKYNAAVEFLNKKDYNSAFLLFSQIPDYKDAEAKIQECYIGKFNVGDIYTFGKYEQDNKRENGKEDIEWLVLAKEDSRILVISKYALDSKSYNTIYEDVTWETCTLRKWLNNDFINSAFTEEEKAKILTVTVTTDDNPEYSTNPSSATQDQVFLLSITEVEKYFTSDSTRQCKYFYNSNSWCWWLRSHGYDCHASYVLTGGGIDYYGRYVNNVNAVRPALWIDLAS